jgi:serine/threonine protein phosphatase PrpC
VKEVKMEPTPQSQRERPSQPPQKEKTQLPQLSGTYGKNRVAKLRSSINLAGKIFDHQIADPNSILNLLIYEPNLLDWIAQGRAVLQFRIKGSWQESSDLAKLANLTNTRADAPGLGTIQPQLVEPLRAATMTALIAARRRIPVEANEPQVRIIFSQDLQAADLAAVNKSLNQDATAELPFGGSIICDGVSTTPASATLARFVSRSMADVLQTHIKRPDMDARKIIDMVAASLQLVGKKYTDQYDSNTANKETILLRSLGLEGGAATAIMALPCQEGYVIGYVGDPVAYVVDENDKIMQLPGLTPDTGSIPGSISRALKKDSFNLSYLIWNAQTGKVTDQNGHSSGSVKGRLLLGSDGLEKVIRNKFIITLAQLRQLSTAELSQIARDDVSYHLLGANATEEKTERVGSVDRPGKIVQDLPLGFGSLDIISGGLAERGAENVVDVNPKGMANLLLEVKEKMGKLMFRVSTKKQSVRMRGKEIETSIFQELPLNRIIRIGDRKLRLVPRRKGLGRKIIGYRLIVK